MMKLIVKFLAGIFDFAAFLFVVAGAIIGWGLGAQSGDEIIMVLVGALFGFISAAVILGIPIIALRINENLEEINKNISTINSKINTPATNKADVE